MDSFFFFPPLSSKNWKGPEMLTVTDDLAFQIRKLMVKRHTFFLVGLGLEFPPPHSCASQVVLVVKNLPAKAGGVRNTGSILGSGRSPRGGHDSPLQYSCLENPIDRGTWQAIGHRVTKSWTELKRLSTQAFYFCLVRDVINFCYC